MTAEVLQQTLDGGEQLLDDLPERETTLVACP
jgi:hypothetical protein